MQARIIGTEKIFKLDKFAIWNAGDCWELHGCVTKYWRLFGTNCYNLAFAPRFSMLKIFHLFAMNMSIIAAELAVSHSMNYSNKLNLFHYELVTNFWGVTKIQFFHILRLLLRPNLITKWKVIFKVLDSRMWFSEVKPQVQAH